MPYSPHIYPAEKQGGCWPTSIQKLVLRAALLPDARAIESWRLWQGQTDVEQLDLGSSRLLPLLRRNLLGLGVPPEELMRYASVSRHAWTKNQFLLTGGAKLVRELEGAGISTMLLKGAALIPLCYGDVVSRPMGDFDLLVPNHEAKKSLNFLLKAGYKSADMPHASRQALERAFLITHAISLENEAGFRFDLHRFVTLFVMDCELEEKFWRDSIPLPIRGVWSRALCFEDQLFHTAEHGVRWCSVPPIRWIADATTLLRAAPDFDWDRFLSKVRQTGLQPPISAALRVLNDVDPEAPLVPREVLREVRFLPSSRATRREWRALATPPKKRSIALSLWLRNRMIARWSASFPPKKRLLALPCYYMAAWGLESPRELPLAFWKRWKAKKGEPLFG